MKIKKYLIDNLYYYFAIPDNGENHEYLLGTSKKILQEKYMKTKFKEKIEDFKNFQEKRKLKENYKKRFTKYF